MHTHFPVARFYYVIIFLEMLGFSAKAFNRGVFPVMTLTGVSGSRLDVIFGVSLINFKTTHPYAVGSSRHFTQDCG